MADEKKPEAKPEARPVLFAPHPDPFVEVVWGILTLLVIVYLINGFLSILNSILGAVPLLDGNGLQTGIVILFLEIFSYLKYILILLSLILTALVIFYYRKLSALRREEAKLLYIKDTRAIEEINPRWDNILKHIESANENDWRLAVLESDIILGEILDNLGLPGETIGDKLKAVEESDFLTINNAWEAHKIRNQIAHEGVVFRLDQKEAKRVIELYGSVFKEFQII